VLTHILFLLSISCFATSFQKGEILSNFNKLSSQQCLDTADYYFNNNHFDTALLYYSTLINIPNDTDVEHQKRVVEAYNKSGNIFLYLGDYRKACSFYIKALLLCEKTNYTSYESKIYNNLGNIYYLFKNLDIAKSYYLKSLRMSRDSVSIGAILNNLGYIEIRNEQYDSAYYYLNESLIICKQHNEEYLNSIWSNMALLFQKTNSYDSAFYYYKLSLSVSQKNNNILKEAENLSQLAELFF
jgi:tetratricopeptide (TPR) repeat protein